ncbi:MAG: bifunctional diguanylate cyclase/phosphodiesterase, partial [Pseudomonadota bacterium]
MSVILSIALLGMVFVQKSWLGDLGHDRAVLAEAVTEARKAGAAFEMVSQHVLDSRSAGTLSATEAAFLSTAGERLTRAVTALGRLTKGQEEATAIWQAPPHRLDWNLEQFSAGTKALVSIPPQQVTAGRRGGEVVSQPIAAPVVADLLALRGQYRARLGPGVEAVSTAALAVIQARQTRLTRTIPLTLIVTAALVVLPWFIGLGPVAAILRATQISAMAAETRADRAGRIDPVTGLPKRKTMLQSIDAAAPPGAPLGLVLIDLAKFSEINDLFGEEVGDAVLSLTASSLGEGLDPGELLGRVGPNAFLLASTGRTAAGELRMLAEDLRVRLSGRHEVAGHVIILEPAIALTCRQGTALADQAEALLMQCELAMPQAKQKGIAHFIPEMRDALRARQRLVRELKAGFPRDEIEPFFQPQVAATSGGVIGFEALIRWRHPERGLLTPVHFLDTAERANLGEELSKIMVAKSLAALRHWREEGCEIPQISLNFSPSELRDQGFIDRLLFDVDRAGLAPSDVAAELLETALIEGPEDPIIATAVGLKQAGFRVDLDDFGTGFASLSTLQMLKVDRIKIDQAFVRDMHLRDDRRQIAEAMIRLAETLGIEA